MGTPAESDTAREATDRFHQILGERDVAEATHRWLVRQQRAVDLQVDGQPLTEVLRPRLISGNDHELVCSAASLLAGALQRLANYALSDGELGDQVRQILALKPTELALAGMSPPVDEGSLHSRLDGFFTVDRLAFVEYNAHSPVGPLTQEALAEIFLGTPAMQAFIEDYRVQVSPARQQMVDCLVTAWTTGGMPGDGPRVAIVECGESQFGWEFDMLRAELRRHGVPAVICSVDDLRCGREQGDLYVDDAEGCRHPITIVYRRAVLNDLLARYGRALIDHPLTRAWSSGACVMVNSFSAHLSNKKSALALLTDPRTSEALSPQEVAAAEEHLPWTRLLRPGRTTYHGEDIDLLPFACAQRENLVLKPNDDYGGHGIVCGWQVADDDWQKELARAVDDDYVIQERVVMPEASYPTWTGKGVIFENYHEGTDPFLFSSTAYGFICRLSPTELINISAGGTCVPAFQVAPRA
jgi:hypothetical protein